MDQSCDQVGEEKNPAALEGEGEEVFDDSFGMTVFQSSRCGMGMELLVGDEHQ